MVLQDVSKRRYKRRTLSSFPSRNIIPLRLGFSERLSKSFRNSSPLSFMMAVKTYLLSLLALLPATTLVSAQSKSWLVVELQTSDSPIDPTQTGPTPALHHVEFKIEDEQSRGLFQCTAEWANADIPRSLAVCDPVEGNDNHNVSFSAALKSYSSASTDFWVDITERDIIVE